MSMKSEKEAFLLHILFFLKLTITYLKKIDILNCNNLLDILDKFCRYYQIVLEINFKKSSKNRFSCVPVERL